MEIKNLFTKNIVRHIKPFVPSSIKKPIKKFMASRYPKIADRNWYREAVGGMWDEIGRLQFNFLVEHGLRPQHYLLDVGCGSLRGGIHFIRYLKPAHYFGIDINKELLNAGRVELKINNLRHKKPTLVEMENFDFLSLNQNFDYALAQSVFTHLPLNSIIKCIMNIERVLVLEGEFYATFFENPEGKLNLEPILHPRVDGPDFATYFDSDPYHYNFELFKYICKGTKLRLEYIGKWKHPRDQRMMVFTKK